MIDSIWYYQSQQPINFDLLVVLQERKLNAIGRYNPSYLDDINQLIKYYIKTDEYLAAAEQIQKTIQFARDINHYGGSYNSGFIIRDVEKVAEELVRLGLSEEAESIKEAAKRFNKNENIQPAFFQLDAFNEMNEQIVGQGSDVGTILDWSKKVDSIFDLGIGQDLVFDQMNQFKAMIRDSFPNWNETQQEIRMLGARGLFEANYSNLVRYHSKEKAFASIAFDQALLYKGLLLAQQSRIRNNVRARKNKDSYQAYKQWASQKRRLDSLYVLSLNELAKGGINLVREEHRLDQLEGALNLHSNPKSEVNYTVTWKAIQNRLSPGEAAIEMVRFRYHDVTWKDEIHYMAMIVKSNSRQPELVIMRNGKALEEKFYSSSNHENGGVDYKSFWAPIQEKLGDIQSVYFSPDGVYHKINLDILELNVSPKSYLIDSIHILRVNSTRYLAVDKYDKASGKTALLFGNPNYNLKSLPKIESRNNLGIQLNLQRKWTELKYTEGEIRIIHDMLKEHGYSSQFFTNNQATEQSLKDVEGPSILHVATHGFFLETVEEKKPVIPKPSNLFEDPEYIKFQKRALVDPNYNFSPDEIRTYNKQRLEQIRNHPYLNSGLVFAGANTAYGKQNPMTNDGLLTAYEIVQLNLENTELVVLSACDTGEGVLRNGEGVYGLQRAFQVAGAKSLIISLWEVPDQFSEELFTAFYTNWLTKDMSKRLAFKTALTEIRESWDHPRYWGAFIYVGI